MTSTLIILSSYKRNIDVSVRVYGIPSMENLGIIFTEQVRIFIFM